MIVAFPGRDQLMFLPRDCTLLIVISILYQQSKSFFTNCIFIFDYICYFNASSYPIIILLDIHNGTCNAKSHTCRREK